MAGGSIVNFEGIGKLAGPAEKLIERVSDGIGVLYEPTRIRRKAKAEADAKETEARKEIEMDRLLVQAQPGNKDLARRALIRFVQEETKAQQNMEDVLQGATRYLNADAEPDKIDDDWLTHFFDRCRTVSNKQMQDLWSRILAGEANQAGAFSKRTVEFVSTVSKRDAEQFTRLCRHVWAIHGHAVPLILDADSPLCTANEIFFPTLSSLELLGLIHFNNLTGFVFRQLPEVVRVSYCGDAFQLTIPGSHGVQKGKLKVGKALFSPMGLELFRVIQTHGLQGMVSHVLEHWVLKGYSPASSWPKDNAG